MQPFSKTAKKISLKISVVALLGPFPLFAEVSGYLGASATVSHWQMGLASGKTVQMFGKDFQTNKPDPFLYMAGISTSFVWNKTWALSYQGEGGVSYPLISLTRESVESSGPVKTSVTLDTKIFRTDHNLAISRTIGTSGVSVFFGAKLQWFRYSEPSAPLVEITTTGTRNNTVSFRQTMLSYGPAVGVVYNARLYKKVFTSFQGGLIYFPGQYSAEATTPNGVNSARENYYGLGFTSLISIAIPLGEQMFFQFAAKGQYYRIQTLTAVATEPGKAEQSAAGTLNGVNDILIGLQAAIIYRMF